MFDLERLLVVAPHADDETIGAGGLLARCARTGVETAVLCVRVHDAERQTELEAACEVLGVSRIATFSPMPVVCTAELIDTIDEQLEAFRPTMVVLPNPAATHQEHVEVARASLAAMRPSGASGRYRPRVAACWEQVADQWAFGHAVSTTLFVELELADVVVKQKAMEAHASQARPFPSERSGEAMESLARVRGAQANVGYAEAYQLRLCVA
jgi:LmbE family N-acetylglucosaminyl deacetylase